MNKDEFYKNAKENNGCLEWQRYINKHGYGYIFVNGETWSIHRYSYFLTYGKIPRKKWVLHKCDNRKCVNPAHLFLGNNKSNTQDRVKKNRSAIGEKNGQSKLTKYEVMKIKLLFKEGFTGLQVAKIFSHKVSQATIYEIKRNEIWKHITM